MSDHHTQQEQEAVKFCMLNKNERIARNLRVIADRIEKSPHEYSASLQAHGGESLFCLIGDQRVPLGFGPAGVTLIIGDEAFVKSYTAKVFGAAHY